MINFPNTKTTTQWTFRIASLLILLALGLHLLEWYKQGTENWPNILTMTGMLMLSLTGAFAPPKGRLRNFCTIASLLLIFPSVFWHFNR